MTIENIEFLFRENYKPMLILANRLLHDEDLARDIVHDIFASLLSGEILSVNSTYLMRGVRFACLNHIRNQSKHESFQKLYAVELGEIECGEWPNEEDIAKLNDIIDKFLPERSKEIIKLRFTNHMKYKEIAERLSISEVSVYKQLQSAINILRQNFNRYER